VGLNRVTLLQWAGSDSNQRPPPCQGGILTRLDHRPPRKRFFSAVSYNIIFQPHVSHLKVFHQTMRSQIIPGQKLENSSTVIYIIYLTLRFKAGRTETWVSNPIEQKKYTTSFIKLNLAIVKPTFLPMLVDILNRLVSFITILRVGCLLR
jgi:hypothetical protein